MRLYIVAYDICEPKRLARVRKVAYGYAFGGQKSALECYLDRKTLREIIHKLENEMNLQTDKLNIIQVDQKAILLGKAKQLPFDKGTIIL